MAITPTSIRHPRLGKLFESKKFRTSTWIALVMVLLLLLATALRGFHASRVGEWTCI